MNDLLVLILTFIAGLLLGGFFFGGLWWTTRKGLLSKSPALWFLGSLIIRLGVTIPLFYAVCRNHWERMLICLAGFIIARMIVVRLVQNKNKPNDSLIKEEENETES